MYENKDRIKMSADDVWAATGSYTMIETEILHRVAGATQASEIKKGIMRSDGVEIGVIGKGFHLEQPRDVFNNTLGRYLESGKLTLENAGYLNKGKRFFANLSINGVSKDVAGHEVRSMLSIGTGFDGGMSFNAYFGGDGRRMVCMNQMSSWFSAMALTENRDDKSVFRARHTKNFKVKQAQALEHIDIATMRFGETIEVYKQLSEKEVSLKRIEAYAREILSAPKCEETSARKENQVGHIVDLSQSRAEIEMVPVNTAYNAYNAVTYYLSHETGNNEENRMNSNLFGDNRKMNSRALELAAAM